MDNQEKKEDIVEEVENNTPEEGFVDEFEKVGALIENLQAENDKLKDDVLRAHAEMENIKRRCAQEIDKNSKYAISSFSKEILSVADNLHRALTAVSPDELTQNPHLEQLHKGVELTESELLKVLSKFGISRMDIMGKVFDPSFHQVIQEIEDKEKPAGTVIMELQTGYMINDRILREAVVAVTK